MDKATLLVALAILAHGWIGRLAPSRAHSIIAATINAIALLLTMYAIFRNPI